MKDAKLNCVKNTIVSKWGGGGAICKLPVIEVPAPQDTFVFISNDKI